MEGVSVDTEIRSPSEAIAKALNQLTIGGFGDKNIAFSGAKMSTEHSESQAPSTNTGKTSDYTTAFNLPGWVMPVAIGFVAVLAAGVVVLAFRK